MGVGRFMIQASEVKFNIIVNIPLNYFILFNWPFIFYISFVTDDILVDCCSLFKKEPAVSTLKERMKTNSKFEINTLPGGKFGLKLARPKPTFMKSSARKYTENEKHTSEFRGGDHNLNTSARKMFRGENNKTFNNIPILNTPTKRKMDFAVVNEVSICPGSPCAILPGQDNSESPAKRRKWGQ